MNSHAVREYWTSLYRKDQAGTEEMLRASDERRIPQVELLLYMFPFVLVILSICVMVWWLIRLIPYLLLLKDHYVDFIGSAGVIVLVFSFL